MIGYCMPYDLFWHGEFSAVDVYLDVAQEKAERERDLINQTCYLQGQYIYTALCCVSPLFRMSLKSGTVKAHPYPDKPFGMEKKQEITPEQEAERQAYMMYRDFKIAEIHEKYSKKGVTDDGRGS